MRHTGFRSKCIGLFYTSLSRGRLWRPRRRPLRRWESSSSSGGGIRGEIWNACSRSGQGATRKKPFARKFSNFVNSCLQCTKKRDNFRLRILYPTERDCLKTCFGYKAAWHFKRLKIMFQSWINLMFEDQVSKLMLVASSKKKELCTTYLQLIEF